MMNEGSENKQEIKALLIKLRIKKVTMSAYHLQANNMIKHRHILIMQTLLKSYENQLY